MPDKLLEIVENKSIALVGNAKYLFDRRYGSEIDSRDIVIRFNKPAIFYEQYNDIINITHGNKINLWAFVSKKVFEDAVFGKEKLSNTFMENYNSNKIKKIYTRSDPINRNDIVYPYYSRLKSEISYNVTMYDIKESHKTIERYNPSKYYHHQPTTGLMVLHWLTQCQPLSIDIYGFDFKKTPTFSEPDKFSQDIKNRVDVRCYHNYEVEEEYVNKVLIPKNKNIRLHL